MDNTEFLRGDGAAGYPSWNPTFSIGALVPQTRITAKNLDPSDKFDGNYFSKPFPTTKFMSGLLRPGPEQYAGASWFTAGGSYKIMDAYPYMVNVLPKEAGSTNPTGISFEIANILPESIGSDNLVQNFFAAAVQGFSTISNQIGISYQYFIAIKELQDSAATSQTVVEGIDDLSVTFTIGNSDHFIRVPIVRGSPYLTVFIGDPNTNLLFFNIQSPTVNQGLMVTKISDCIYSVQTAIDRKEFRLYLGQPPAQDLAVDPTTHSLEIPGQVGWIRIICISSNIAPGTQYGKRNFGVFDSSIADRSYQNIPLSGKVIPSLNSTTNQVELKSVFQLCATSVDNTLYYCIPPHYTLKTDPNVEIQDQNSFSYYHLKGFCRVVKMNDATVGLTRAIDAVSLDLDIAGGKAIDPSRQQEIITALQADYHSFSQNFNAYAKSYQQPYNLYTQGSLLFGYAYLLVIAEQLGQKAIAEAIYADLIGFFKTMFLGKGFPSIIPAFTCQYIAYDGTWGGILYPQNSTAPGANPPEDEAWAYGFNWYADHHFHLGYYVFIAAILYRYFGNQIQTDPDWASTSFQSYIYTLIGDYGCPSPSDSLFPYSRMKDFFWGHSHSLGIKYDAGADGENQESSSEAINAYYAMAQLGNILGDSGLEEWGTILTTMELEASQVYYQTYNNNYLADDSLQPQWGIVPNLWDNKVDSGTYWGNEPIFTAAIEMLPPTGITRQLFPPENAIYAFQTMTNRINCTIAKPIAFPNRPPVTSYPFPKLDNKIFNGKLNDQSSCSVGGAPGTSWLPQFLVFLALTSPENAAYCYDLVKDCSFVCSSTAPITVQDPAGQFLPVTAAIVGTIADPANPQATYGNLYPINAQTKTFYLYYFATLSPVSS
jgi:endoglucanase Acf2